MWTSACRVLLEALRKLLTNVSKFGIKRAFRNNLSLVVLTVRRTKQLRTSPVDKNRSANETSYGTHVGAIDPEDKMSSCFTSCRTSRDRCSIPSRGMIFWLVAMFGARELPIFFQACIII